jgi:hypothetical protein
MCHVGGSWDSPTSTCTLEVYYGLDSEETLYIPSGANLTIGVYGTLSNNFHGGNIQNYGTITDSGVIESIGVFNNTGTITITKAEDAQFEEYSPLFDYGDIINYGTNYGGIILRYGGVVHVEPGGTTTNYGIVRMDSISAFDIDAKGTLVNYGSILGAGVSLQSTGPITNYGNFTNRGSFDAGVAGNFTNEVGATFYNTPSGTVTNSGPILNYGNVTNSGSITITCGGQLTNEAGSTYTGNPPVHGCTTTTSTLPTPVYPGGSILAFLVPFAALTALTVIGLRFKKPNK